MLRVTQTSIRAADWLWRIHIRKRLAIKAGIVALKLWQIGKIAIFERLSFQGSIPKKRMRFSQVDRITELTPGESITAVRSLSLVEEYLKDHFPRFPVMPGVLMVEALFQTGMWLVRVTDNFQHAVVALRKTSNMKFSGFVQPGDQLVMTAKIKATNESLTRLKVSGTVNGVVAASGMITIDSYNLSDRNLGAQATDDYMKQKFRLTYKLLCNQLEADSLARFADISN